MTNKELILSKIKNSKRFIAGPYSLYVVNIWILDDCSIYANPNELFIAHNPKELDYNFITEPDVTEIREAIHRRLDESK